MIDSIHGQEGPFDFYTWPFSKVSITLNNKHPITSQMPDTLFSPTPMHSFPQAKHPNLLLEKILTIALLSHTGANNPPSTTIT